MTILTDVGVAKMVNNSIAIVACVHNLILLCYHSYYTFPCFTKTKATKLQYLSLITISMQFILTIYINLNDWNVYSFSCEWGIKYGLIIYSISKISLYVLFLERLFGVFANSAMAFKTIFIIIARIFYALLLLFGICSTMIVGNGAFNEATGSCEAIWPVWLVGLGAINDLLSCSIISILFARRMLALSLTQPKQTKNNESKVDIYDAVSDESLLTILRKSTLLTIIGVLTTPLSLVLSAIIVWLDGMWISIDTMINIWCVMLMFSRYNKLYGKLCGILERCLTIRCLSCYSCYCCCGMKIKKENESNISPSSSEMELPSTASTKTTSTNNSSPQKSDVQRADS